ncbi:MAG: response regulator [Lachnospiraceae bacterium]|nr:response regulator [Lachnospiraceae bacterium]
MRQRKERNELFQASHLIILISYTLFSLILLGESALMGWESWAFILIPIGLIAAWITHILQSGTDMHRLWVYSVLMMCTFFFYGIHETSVYDLAIVMSAVIMLYTISGVKNLISLCQMTYYLTLCYGLIVMSQNGTVFDPLVISRTILHVTMITMIGWFARMVIDKWNKVLKGSDKEIEELTDATDRLNDFLANMSHEIRTPINAVIGLSQVCIEKEMDEELRSDMEAVSKAGVKVSEQISDILDYSEIDRNSLAINEEEYMISSVLCDLVNKLKPYTRDDIELVIDVDPSIPAAMQTDVYKLKKILWHLMMNGLKYTKEGGVYVRISAIKQDYGINLHLEVTDTGIGMNAEEVERITEGFYQADSGRTRSSSGLGLGMSVVSGFVAALGGFLTIESTPGVGTTFRMSIPQKVLDPVSCMSVENREDLCLGAFLHFEKFENPSVREYYNSMVRNIVLGLGVQMHRVDNLENLKKLVSTLKLTHLFVGQEEYEADVEYMESIAGDIMVEIIAKSSFELPKGAKAHIMEKPFYCFPVVGVLNSRQGDNKVSERRLLLRGVEALVVDDEIMNLPVACSILNRYEMNVKTAMSGPEAIDLCREKEYDIVFMDHMMPGMDGIETMKHIRAEYKRENKDVPIVALTANAVSTAREMFMKEGFDGFVSKPIEIVELERVLVKVLPRTMIEYEDVSQPEKEASKPEGNKEVKKDIPDKRTDIKEEKDKYAFLKELNIDVDQGLHYCQGDTDLYDSLLKQFVAESVTKKAGLEEHYKDKSMYDYEILVHALKSTSKMIGAMELSEEAKSIESKVKEGATDISEDSHNAMMKHYSDLIDSIRQHIEGVKAPENNEETAGEDDIIEFAPENGGEE